MPAESGVRRSATWWVGAPLVTFASAAPGLLWGLLEGLRRLDEDDAARLMLSGVRVRWSTTWSSRFAARWGRRLRGRRPATPWPYRPDGGIGAVAGRPTFPSARPGLAGPSSPRSAPPTRAGRRVQGWNRLCCGRVGASQPPSNRVRWPTMRLTVSRVW